MIVAEPDTVVRNPIEAEVKTAVDAEILVIFKLVVLGKNEAVSENTACEALTAKEDVPCTDPVNEPTKEVPVKLPVKP